jgi:hypothetical protein
VAAETGTTQLELQAFAMGVGDQHCPTSRGAHRVEELDHVGMHRDQVFDLLFQQRDVEVELLAPVVDAVPGHRALDRAGALGKHGTRVGERQRVTLGVTPRHVLEPEVVVEMQIEQRAVHVQQQRADLLPVDQRRHVGSHGTPF